MYINTVDGHTFELLERLMSDSELSNFYLVGGTALTLQMGFRKSIDLDLFTNDLENREELEKHLSETYGFISNLSIKRTLLGRIGDVKTDFINYPYPPIRPMIVENGIRMLGVEDIAAMKLSAIMNSGKRLKDFVDVAFLSTKFSLIQMLGFFSEKFPQSSVLSAEKSLLYFEDIDFSVPIVLASNKFRWIPIKKRILEMAQYPTKVFGPLDL